TALWRCESWPCLSLPLSINRPSDLIAVAESNRSGTSLRRSPASRAVPDPGRAPECGARSGCRWLPAPESCSSCAYGWVSGVVDQFEEFRVVGLGSYAGGAVGGARVAASGQALRRLRDRAEDVVVQAGRERVPDLRSIRVQPGQARRGPVAYLGVVVAGHLDQQGQALGVVR